MKVKVKNLKLFEGGQQRQKKKKFLLLKAGVRSEHHTKKNLP